MKAFSRDQVVVHARERLSDDHLKVDKLTLSHPAFAGGSIGPIQREVISRADAVAVLLYDPRADQVVLVQQFRAGVFAAGDPEPWLLEIVAGLVEEGESAEDVARRESEEEAGYRVGRIEPVLNCYSSPGMLSERFVIFCGEIEARPGERLHGLAHEHEDIRAITLPRAEAFGLIEAGVTLAGPAATALLWLQLNHERLRIAWT